MHSGNIARVLGLSEERFKAEFENRQPVIFTPRVKPVRNYFDARVLSKSTLLLE
jgi:hypothetical protein